MVGTRMAAIALPWFVLATTGSAAKTGAVAFAELLPYVLASAFGGPLIDRLGAWRISVAADVASAGFVVAIPLLHERIGFGGVVALVVVVGVLRGFGDTSKRAVFPRVVARSGMDMTRAASLNDGLARLSTLLGAPAGGLLIAAFDAPVVLAVDAATFAAAGLIVALRGARPGRGERGEGALPAGAAGRPRVPAPRPPGRRADPDAVLHQPVRRRLHVGADAALGDRGGHVRGPRRAVRHVRGRRRARQHRLHRGRAAGAAVRAVHGRFPGRRRAPVRRGRVRRDLGGVRGLVRRRSRDRRDQPDPRRGHLRADPRADDGPGAGAGGGDGVGRHAAGRAARRLAGRRGGTARGAARARRALPARDARAAHPPDVAPAGRPPGGAGRRRAAPANLGAPDDRAAAPVDGPAAAGGSAVPRPRERPRRAAPSAADRPR